MDIIEAALVGALGGVLPDLIKVIRKRFQKMPTYLGRGWYWLNVVFLSALERERLCSSDPVCADHDPTHADEDRMLYGAACHGCLLISETSCEARNVSLDRALLVDTLGTVEAAFF